MPTVSAGQSTVIKLSGTEAIWVNSTGVGIAEFECGSPTRLNLTSEYQRIGYFGADSCIELRSVSGTINYQSTPPIAYPLTATAKGDKNNSSPVDVALLTNGLVTGATPIDAITLAGLPQTAGAPEGFGDLATAVNVAAGSSSVTALDIWDAFNSDFTAATYAQYIAGVDSLLLPSATKADLGICSNGADRVYSYSFGSGAKKLFILSGQHGEETLGQIASLRFVEQFIKSNHPMMQYFRSVFSLVFIPVANPSGYRNIAHDGRVNANGVNLNRNYSPNFWTYFVPPTANDAKGSAGFSEVETQYIKAVVDSFKPDVAIDCHNVGAGYGAQDIYTQTASSWHAFSRQPFIDSVVSDFSSRYNTAVGDLTPNYRNYPNFVGWFARYSRAALGKKNTVTVTLEAESDLDGSAYPATVTRSAMQKYCGFIATFAQAALQQPFSAELVPSYAWRCFKNTNAGGVSITTGGSLVDTTTETPLTWNAFAPNDGGSGAVNYIDVVAPCDGQFVVEADGYVVSTAATYGRTEVAISVNGTKAAESVTSVTPALVADARTPFSCSLRIAITQTGELVTRIQLLAYKVNAAHTNCNLFQPRMTITFIPNAGAMQVPRPR